MSLFARLRRRSRDERGVTLIELTLAMLIMSIVMLLAFNFLDHASLLTLRTEANAQSEQDAQQALRVVTQQVRGALPIGDPCSPSDDTATVGAPGPLPAGYADCMKFSVKRIETGLDSCLESTFIFALVGPGSQKKLVEDRTDFTRVGGVCTATERHRRRIHLDKVVNTSGQPLFRYFSSSGAEIPATVGNAAAVKKATTVRVTLAVKFHGNANPSVFSSSAALRNNISR